MSTKRGFDSSEGIEKDSKKQKVSANTTSTTSTTTPITAIQIFTEKLVEIENTILFIALCNDRARYFIPSTENYFAKWKVDQLMIDNGCGSMLLPLVDDNSLDELIKHFPSKKFYWRIGSEVHSSICSLNIAPVSPESQQLFLSCKLAKDLFQNKFMVESLTFHLVLKDAETLLALPTFAIPKRSSTKLTRTEKVEFQINTKAQEFLKRFIEAERKLQEPTKRRDYGLIGQDFLGSMKAIIQSSYPFPTYSERFMYAISQSVDTFDFKELTEKCASISQQIRKSTTWNQFRKLEITDHFEDHFVTYPQFPPNPFDV